MPKTIASRFTTLGPATAHVHAFGFPFHLEFSQIASSRMYKELGNHKMARAACLRCGDLVGAAESCEQEAQKLQGAAAEEQLQQAINHYKKAKQHLLGFQLLQRHPHLAHNMTPEVCPPCSLGQDTDSLLFASGV